MPHPVYKTQARNFSYSGVTRNLGTLGPDFQKILGKILSFA